MRFQGLKNNSWTWLYLRMSNSKLENGSASKRSSLADVDKARLFQSLQMFESKKREWSTNTAYARSQSVFNWIDMKKDGAFNATQTIWKSHHQLSFWDQTQVAGFIFDQVPIFWNLVHLYTLSWHRLYILSYRCRAGDAPGRVLQIKKEKDEALKAPGF